MMMAWFMKLMGWALALSELLTDLNAVKAKAPGTSVADYTQAAAVILAQPGIDAWLARVEQQYGAGKADAIREQLPFVLWGIDFATER
jgi:hypothetical protein